MSFFKKLLNLIYPENNHCLKCNENYIFSEITGLCSDCLSQLPFLEHYCFSCGRALIDESRKYCSFCSENGFAFDQARSAGLYSDLLKFLILKFKYELKLSISETLGEILYYTFQLYYQKGNINEIVYVPIHNQRRKERGFNQAELIAQDLSKKIKIPLNSKVERIKVTPPLYNYAFHERENILKDSFALENNLYKGKTLLLLDDVLTTGATANELARVLKEVGGANKVFLLTVATAITY
ncbi:ComF family protein [Natronospora cellulosivora (SeqCode)]